MQVMYLGRAPRTKETLPDFLKWRRITRHPLVFRGLTGSQRTPGFWGVTEDEPSVAENWLERTERMLVQMHCTAEEKFECATSLLQDKAYQWWISVTRTAAPREIYMEILLG